MDHALTTEEKMWEQFHKLWSGQVGVPGYIKKEWTELESRILAALKESKNDEHGRTLR